MTQLSETFTSLLTFDIFKLSDLQKRMKKRGLQGRNTNAADLKDVLDAIFLRKIKKNGTLSRRSFFDKKMKLDLTGKSKARGKSIALNDHSYVKNMIMEALKVPRDDRKQLRELFDAYYRSHDYIIGKYLIQIYNVCWYFSFL